MKKKLDTYYEAAKVKPAYACASFLDPRIKHHYLKTDKEYYTKVRKQFTEALKPFEKAHADPTDAASAEPDDDQDSSFGFNIFKKQKVCNMAAEVRKYLQEDVIGGKTDPFEYWRFKSSLFPSLAAMAKTYLSIPSTSTPLERAFSMGRLVIHHTRANLAAQTIIALMCLNSWNKNAFLNAL